MCYISKLFNKNLELNKKYKVEIIKVKSYYEFDILFKHLCSFEEYKCKLYDLNNLKVDNNDIGLLTNFNTSLNQCNRNVKRS